jgi:signal peptidase I
MISSASILGDKNALKCELAGEVLRSSGHLRLRVTGWSMLPTVMPGDTLVIERVESSKVCEGDIVLFGRDRRFFVHRVMRKSGDLVDAEFITCGDAMPAPDSPVFESELMGRVSFILRNRKCFEPARSLTFPERAIAALARRSILAARVVVGVHGIRQASSCQTVQDQSQTRAQIRIQT